MERRHFNMLLGGSVFAVPRAVHPKQSERKVYRIGYLGAVALPPRASGAFREALEQHGYIEGTNLFVERRFAEGRDDRLAVLAAELARLHLDVIVTQTGSATQAAKDATATTPIVMVSISDPVGRGFAVSLARPGGNITGITDLQVDLIPKRLEFLKAAVPGASRVVTLSNAGGIDATRLAALRREQVERARALDVTLLRVELEAPKDFEKAVAEIVKLNPDALHVAPTPVNFVLRGEIAEFALRRRLATIGSRSEQVEAGMLMSYGASFSDAYRKAASYVDKILKGGKPSDMPIEQPTKLELVINRRTAKALGLALPQALLQRADEVIQ